MKIYLSGVNVVVDLDDGFHTPVYIPKDETRLLNFPNNDVGVFDQTTGKTYKDDFSLILNEFGVSYGATKDDVLLSLSGFVGGGVSNMQTLTRRFDGFSDFVFYADEYCEMRWLASVRQPQFRVKGLWGWVDAGILLQQGGSSVILSNTSDVFSYNDASVFSAWKYFTTFGVFDASFNHADYGAKSQLHVLEESIVHPSLIPSYTVELMRGLSSSLVVVVQKIVG